MMSTRTTQDFTIAKTSLGVVNDTQAPDPAALSSNPPFQPLQYLNRNRFYRPDLGRFLSVDALQGGYAYVGNGPTFAIDPTGLVRLIIEDPKVVYEDWVSIGTACSKWGAYGCTKADMHAGCRCSENCGVWHPSVVISLKGTIFVAANNPKAISQGITASMIARHEQLHWGDYKTAWAYMAAARGAAEEALQFSSGATCWASCRVFELSELFNGLYVDLVSDMSWDWFGHRY
jgi:hypothetical protein